MEKVVIRALDKWFRAEVAKGIKEADDPATLWVSHDDARANRASKRAQLVKRAKPVKPIKRGGI